MASTIFNLDLVSVGSRFRGEIKSTWSMDFSLEYFQQLKDIDFAFIPLIIAFMCGILNLFVYCFFGVMATQSYEDMADCLYDSKWQELPIDLQKYIMLMIQNMQVPMYYTGFGFAILDLHTFTSVGRVLNILKKTKELNGISFDFAANSRRFLILHVVQNIGRISGIDSRIILKGDLERNRK